MPAVRSTVFALPAHLAAKADPALIAEDERRLRSLADRLDTAVHTTAAELDDLRRSPAGPGSAALERDQAVHRLAGRLRVLRRYGLDLCLGRMDFADGRDPVHIGRIGLGDGEGGRLLVDWRSPAAEPFFAATLADPRGLSARRRYRWTQGQVTDYWDEVFAPELAAAHGPALDDDAAFIASLGASRSPRMRDVLGTIAADQDAIIRAGSAGTLVVDGGPGTGKTVVALHRAAYLTYADPRLGARRGGVLVVGPHQPYLAYVSDVLPSLGEDGVATCTLTDLVPEGSLAAARGEEADPEVARLKADARMVAALEPAVALYEEPPTSGMLVETEWAEVWLSAADWADAFGAPDPGTPHNEARDEVWEALVLTLLDKHAQASEEDGPTEEQVRRALARCPALVDAFTRAWPLLEPADVVGDLWDVPAYLRRCAPWLREDDVRRLRRTDPQAWTTADLPLLDAAHRRLGDPDAGLRRRNEARRREELAARNRVVDHLIANDDSEMQLMAMLRVDDLQGALVDGAGDLPPDADPLAGPFAHVIVDEAQELTDAEWQMLIARCPSRSFTVVGDRAQARRGFAESWTERLERVGLDRITRTGLSVNYRTPTEVMAEAEPVIRTVLPDANVPTSIRSSGLPVRHGRPDELDAILAAWRTEHAEGTACVIGAPHLPDGPRVRSLDPVRAKGLEFDLVVLVEPETFGSGVAAAVDRYVAMTRSTRELVILHATEQFAEIAEIEEIEP